MKNNEFNLEYIVSKSEELDDESFKILLKKMSSYYTGLRFNELCDFINDSDVEIGKKTIFLLRAASIVDINDTENRDFNLEYIPYFLGTCIQSNKEGFVNLVTEDPKMQELLVGYIKKFPGSSMVIWPKVSNLPQVREKIWVDERFVIDVLSKEREFYENIPEEYTHFICFYEVKNTKMDIEYMRLLYQKYYGDILPELDQLYLIYWQIKLRENNRMNINPRVFREPLDFGLKKLREDEHFFDLKEKLQLKIHELMQLAFNYRNSSLYNELISMNEIDEELAQKIKLISRGRKIIGIDTFEDLRSITLDELNNMERESIQVEDISNTVKPNTGGPSSRTLENIFTDSTEREIRRINQDGTMATETIERLSERHEDAIKRIYEGEVDYLDNCDSVYRCSIEAIKQLSTITLVIEKEQCYIYLPENLTAEQKRVILELISSAEEEGRFGIVSYNTQTGKVTFHYEGMDVEKDLAIVAISRFGRDINHGLNDSEPKLPSYEDDER